MYKIGILETHPIQYKAPWFRLLHKHPDIDLMVFYCMIPDSRQQGQGFGVEFNWDIPLLNGYKYHVLNNIAKDAGSHHFKGCDTPEIYHLLNSPNSKFDAFIINGWHVKACLQALWACKKIRVPVIVRGDSNALHKRIFYKHFLHRLMFKLYDAFLVVGKSNQEFYRQRGVPEKKIFFASHAIDNQRFEDQAGISDAQKKEYRDRWKIPPDAVCFCFSGKFEKKKRPIDILVALDRIVRRSQEKIHLLMIGDGVLRKECEIFSRTRKLPVTFAGFLNQKEIPGAYKICDCLILPSDYGETWGLVVNEAMACGIPAIVSDRVGCYPDLIVPGKTGHVTPFGDTDALATIMSRYLNNEKNLHQMGYNARKHIKYYSIENIVKGTLEAVRSVSIEKSINYNKSHTL